MSVEIYHSRLGEELRAEICVPIMKKELVTGNEKKRPFVPRKPARKTAKKATMRSTQASASKRPARVRGRG